MPIVNPMIFKLINMRLARNDNNHRLNGSANSHRNYYRMLRDTQKYKYMRKSMGYDK